MMAMPNGKGSNEPNQHARFLKTAHQLGCDEDEAALEDKPKAIAKAKPMDKPIPNRSGQLLTAPTLAQALAVLLLVAPVAARAKPNSTNTTTGIHSMSESQMVTLFGKWERVWHEGQFNLVPECVGENYTRHDENGTRTVTRDAYAAEIAKIREERPGIRVVVYDHAFQGDRAWFRFAFKWTDPKTGAAMSRAGMQSYRTENGKLVETWLGMQPPGSSWSDVVAQATWTSPPPIR